MLKTPTNEVVDMFGLGNPPDCYKIPVSKLGLNQFKRNTINGTNFSSSTYMLRLLVWILEWEPNNLPFLHQAAKIIWDKVETKGRSKSPPIAHGKSNWQKNRVQYISPAGTFEKCKYLMNILLFFLSSVLAKVIIHESRGEVFIAKHKCLFSLFILLFTFSNKYFLFSRL